VTHGGRFNGSPGGGDEHPPRGIVTMAGHADRSAAVSRVPYPFP